jgi:hypothetical protein
VNRIIPPCKELEKILKRKRRSRKGIKLSREFPSDDENIIFIVIVKLLESYFREFDLQKYKTQLLPLAKELYKHHVNSSDLVLLNSLLRCGNNFSASRKKQNPCLHAYFPNLE